MPFSKSIREESLVRSHRHCCVCHEFSGRDVNVHHIIQESDGGPNTLENAIVVCLRCHSEAGHYNTRHPLGTKYSPEELRKHRDQWWEQCAKTRGENPASPLPSSTKLYGSGRVSNFRDSYLFSETGCLPFGGRDAEMKLLNDWLADDFGPGRLLITGPTGRGKSALLVRWTEMVANTSSDDAWHIVFVPISMRFGTNRPSVFYSLFATQLAEILDSPLQSAAIDPEGFYSGVSSSMLQQLAGTTTKVLIVVDGIDEALDQRFDATIFPLQLPSTIKIILSAREQANDAGSLGWKRRLGWDTGVRVTPIELSTLKRPGVVDVLQSVELSANEIPDEIVGRVLQLSEGEPLLVKLCAEDLSAIAKNNGCVNIKDLDGLSPGFGAYFFRWIELQRQAWKDEGCAINDSAVDGTLAVLSCAFGPLQAEHLVPLVCKISELPPPLSVEHFIKPLKRFIAGRGTLDSGFVLNHPKLGQYLCEEYFDGAAIYKMHFEFANWGRATVDLIKQEDSVSIDVPPYLLQYYTQHLAFIQGTVDDYASLLSNGWRLAWEKFEGGYRGYSADIRSILNRLGATEQYLPDVTNSLRIRVRAALCLSSVQSIGSNCPSELLVLALDEGLLTLQQAIHYIDLQLPENRSQFYAAIFRHLTEDQADEVIDAIYKTKDIGNRALFLVRILGNVPKIQRDRLLDDILDLKNKMKNKIDSLLQSAGLMIDLVPHLGSEHLNNAFLEIISIPTTIKNTTFYAKLLGKLTECFEQAGDSQKTAETLQRSLALLDGIDNVFAKVNALSELAQILPNGTLQAYVDLWFPLVEERASELLTKVRPGDYKFEINMQIQDARHSQAKLMLLRAQHLTDSEYDEQLNKVLELVNTLDEDWGRVDVLTSLLRFIRKENKHRIIQFCFQMARQLPTGNNRTHALTSLAKETPHSLRTDIIREGLINARLIEDDYSRCLTLVALFSQLSQNEKLSEFPSVMTEINKIRYALHRGEVILKLAPQLPEQAERLFEMGVSLISMVSDAHSRTTSLINAMETLPDELRNTIFRKCFEQILTERDGLVGLTCALLVEKTTDLWNKEDLEAAFRLSYRATHILDKTLLLPALVPLAARFGRNDIIGMALAEILAQQDKQLQAGGLVKIIPYVVSSEERSELVGDALDVAMGIPSTASKSTTLIGLLPVLSGEQREEIWHLAKYAVLQVDNNWGHLKNLSDCCFEEDEKKQLIQASFASAVKSPPTTMVPAVGELAPILGSISEQLLALDLITEQTGVSRTTLLSAIERAAPAFASTGGTNLVRQLIHDIIENAAWWQ